MFYNIKLNNINLKKGLVALIIVVLGFVGVIGMSSIAHADTITKDSTQWWVDHFNQAKSQLHNIGDKVLIGQSNGHDIYLSNLKQGYTLTTDSSAYSDGCGTNVGNVVDAIGATVIIAGVAAGVGLAILGQWASAAAIIAACGQLPNTRNMLVSGLIVLVC